MLDLHAKLAELIGTRKASTNVPGGMRRATPGERERRRALGYINRPANNPFKPAASRKKAPASLFIRINAPLILDGKDTGKRMLVPIEDWRNKDG
jgi:hypothetical protein